MDTATAKKKTGERLKQLRESLGYTQEKFSEILGISVTLYKKICPCTSAHLPSLIVTQRSLGMFRYFLLAHHVFLDRRLYLHPKQ